MSAFVLKDAKVFVNEFDVSADHNEIALNLSIDEVENTTFGGGTHSFSPGLRGIGGVHHGFWDAAEPDAEFFAAVGSGPHLHSIIVPDGSDGDRGFFFNASAMRYSPSGAIGEMFAFDIEWMAQGDFIGGTSMAAYQSRSSSFNGTAYQLGAPGTTTPLTVYSAIHCTAFNGTTLDVVVQSDTVGFGSPTARITHTQLTDVGYELSTFTAGTTDDYWRTSVTFVGTSFTLAHIVAIGQVETSR